MIYARFTDSETVYACTEIDRMTETLVALTFQGTAVQDTSGFVFARYPDMEVINGDYTAFKTIYRVDGLKVIFSSDGSVDTEPET